VPNKESAIRCLTTLFAAALMLISPRVWSQDEHHHALTEQEIGSVHFSTSCRAENEQSFNHAVALLHSFQYEQSREAFSDIAAKNPQCAMAQWGIAMSHYHGLWSNGDTAAGRAALLNAEQIAAANPATTPRERGYIDALAQVYAEDSRSKSAREQDYEKKMGELQAANPNDSEAAIFHALSLAVTAPKTDKTFANQKKCGEILLPIFKEQPHHPGVAHYIIHCYDNTVLAGQGLEAARLYATIAPASAHANHMPSHIFTRVGAWQESIASNLKSAGLAAAAEKTSKNGEARDQRLHALDYLEYAYLQYGQVAKAKSILDEIASLAPVAGVSHTNDYAVAAIPARCAVELQDWEQASELKARSDGAPWASAITWEAIGEGSARAGHLERAVEAEKMLASLRDATAKQGDPYWANQVEVQRREVAGWIAQKSDKPAEAIARMKSAAELEESMDKNAVTPGPITPAREMLAQLLFLNRRPQESAEEYEKVLEIAPNRFNAVYGMAMAAEAAGNAQVANDYFRELTKIAAGGERRELAIARKKIGAVAKNVPPPSGP
jgi:tetratricopeptide (TPR) repeat protein